MSRDKQIVVRVSLEEREQLKVIASDADMELGALLYKVLSRIAQGELDLLSLAGYGGSANFSDGGKLAGIEGELSLIKKRLTLLEQRQGKVIEIEAIATEPAENEAIEEKTPLRMPHIERKDIATMNHPKPIQGADDGAGNCQLFGNKEFIKAALGFGVELTRNHATNWKRDGKFTATPEGQAAAQYFGVVQGKGFYRL